MATFAQVAPKPTAPEYSAANQPAETIPATEPAAELRTAIRHLLAHHTSGDIIEAAWEVSAQMFRESLAARDASQLHPAAHSPALRYGSELKWWRGNCHTAPPTEAP